MHPDVHLMLHHTRATELQRSAPVRNPRSRLRDRCGWTLVELGLRLVNSSGPARPSAGPAASRPFPSMS
ncbi:hypothetical protein AB0B59_18265 [Streptomyces huasconensis]